MWCLLFFHQQAIPGQGRCQETGPIWTVFFFNTKPGSQRWRKLGGYFSKLVGQSHAPILFLWGCLVLDVSHQSLNSHSCLSCERLDFALEMYWRTGISRYLLPWHMRSLNRDLEHRGRGCLGFWKTLALFLFSLFPFLCLIWLKKCWFCYVKVRLKDLFFKYLLLSVA